MLALDGVVDVLDELDGAGGDAGAAVAGDGYEVEGVIDLDGAGEVGEEFGCAFEDSDEDDGFAFVVGGYLGADLAVLAAICSLVKRISIAEAGGKVSSGVLMGMRVRLARNRVEGKSSVLMGVPPPHCFAQNPHSIAVRFGPRLNF